MIDKRFFEPNLAIYYRDFLVSLGVFALAFGVSLHVTWPWVIAPWAAASVFLARAGIFGHELSHRMNDRRMRGFHRLWHLTGGAIIMMPIVRFTKPHLTHHATGTFRTSADPQYLLLRSNKALAVFVLIGLPFLTPLYTLFQTIVASLGGMAQEERIDRFTRRRFNFSVSMPIPEAHHAGITRYSRYTLVLLVSFAILAPQALPIYYAALVGAWTIVVLRIPLEHQLEAYAASSSFTDQMSDSFTVESPLAAIIQPVGFRYHTAHHMYPGVPYHNLPALHAHLKATVPDYHRSIISYWTAIRGPKAWRKEDLASARLNDLPDCPSGPSPERQTRT
jgi:fatty acid desaturase